MGSLILPATGPVYVDTQVCIYTVEQHPVYSPLLKPLWAAVSAGAVHVVTSELTLMEVLVGPIRRGDTKLEADYEEFLQFPGIRMIAMTPAVLRAAARLRGSNLGLRTPDALHAATAQVQGVSLLITNDRGFHTIEGLPITLLDEILTQ